MLIAVTESNKMRIDEFVNNLAEEPAVDQNRIAGWPSPAQSSELRNLQRITYIGPNATNWDEDRAREAQEMERNGATPEEIWRDTRTIRGTDNAWRQEIDDSDARLKITTPEIAAFDADTFEVSGRRYRADEVLDHPELFDAYPELRDYEIAFYDNSDDVGSRGFLISSEKLLGVGAYDTNDEGRLVLTDPRDILSTTMHEIGGHGVQNIEPDFETGGSAGPVELDIYNKIRDTDADPSITRDDEWIIDYFGHDAYNTIDTLTGMNDVYRGYGGEIDARSIQNRLDMDDEERSQNMPKFDDSPIIVTRRNAPPENLANNPNVTVTNIFGRPVNVTRNPNWDPRDSDNLPWPDSTPSTPRTTPEPQEPSSTPSTPRRNPLPSSPRLPGTGPNTGSTPNGPNPNIPRRNPLPSSPRLPGTGPNTGPSPGQNSIRKQQDIMASAIVRANKIFNEARKNIK